MKEIESLEKLLPLLKAEFPRRKFELLHEEKPHIQVVGAYTTIHYSTPTTFQVRVGNYYSNRFLTPHALGNVSRAFEEETELRNKQSKERSEMRKLIAKLKNCEMFDEDRFNFELKGFSAEGRDIPEIEITFKELPNYPIAHVQYVCYSTIPAQSRYRVYFGDRLFELDTPKDILNIFDSGEIFKTLDKETDADNIQVHSKAVNGKCIGVVKLDENFRKQVPYLLMMQASNLEVDDVDVITVVNDGRSRQEGEQSLLTQLFDYQTTLKYLRFQCHPELKWQRIYRG